MLLCNYRGVVVCLLLLCCWETNGFGYLDKEFSEFDMEIDDDSFDDNEMERKLGMESEDNLHQEEDILPLNDLIDDEERVLAAIDSQDVEEHFLDKDADDVERGESGASDEHLMGSKVTEDNFLENMLMDILRNYDVNGITTHRTSCPVFVKPTLHAKINCGKVTTMFGKIKWCHVQCNTGYKLKHTFPQYELCGKSTKYRWTYELRGLTEGTERCVPGSSSQNLTACTTTECFGTASYYMNRIDFSVNPCNDFYDFACGRWIKENPIPAFENKLDTMAIVRERVFNNVAALLGKPYKKGECAAVKKAKIAYKACMNTALIDKLDDKPLKKLLKGSKMGWPIVDKTWKTSGLFVEKTWAKIRGLYNNQVFMKVTVARKNGTHVIQTWNGGLALPTSYYLDGRHEAKLKAYYDLFRDIALMLGGDPKTVAKDVSSVKKFERKLAYHKVHDKYQHTSMTIKEMQLKIPGVMNWLKTFKLMILSHPITKSTVIQVWNVKFMQNLQALIKSGGKRTVQNYIIWRLVKHRVKNLSLRFQKRYLMYEKALYGTRSLTSRSYKCSSELILSMKGATSKLYIDKHFPTSKKKAATELFTYIRDGFIQLLHTEVTWMDKKTKDYAIRKANAVIYDIGYNPKIYQNTTYLDNQVSHLRVNVGDYFGNTLRALTTIAQNKFKLIGQSYDPKVVPFTYRPTMVNSFYSNSYNRIMILAAIMQYPMYWGDTFPRVFQYGAMGSIVGHELTHGFDDTGRLYGVHGNRYNWWSAEAVAGFRKRSGCLVNQYNNFYSMEAGLYLNGTRTLTENIADNGGIREAYVGYHMWLKANGLTGEQIEPTTGFTNDQMFFIGAGGYRCGHSTHASAVHEVNTDSHSPSRFRTVGSLQNFDKFAEAFNCPLGSYMNPIKKCIIW